MSKHTTECFRRAACFAIQKLLSYKPSLESGSTQLHLVLLLSKITWRIKAWASELFPLHEKKKIKKKESHSLTGTSRQSRRANVSLKGQTHLSTFCTPICSVLMTDRYQQTAGVRRDLSGRDTGGSERLTWSFKDHLGDLRWASGSPTAEWSADETEVVLGASGLWPWIHVHGERSQQRWVWGTARLKQS